MTGVLVTTDCDVSATWEETVRRDLPAGTELLVFPSWGAHTHLISIQLMRWLEANVGAFDLVVVRSLQHPLSSYTAWVARRRDVPYVVVPHGSLSRYSFTHRRRLAKKLYFTLVDRRTLVRAACVRLTSEDERETVRALAPLRDCRVIPHPIRSDGKADSRSANRSSNILFLSRLDRKKRIELLLDAFPQVRAAVPEARLFVAGSGAVAYERRLRRMVDALGMADSVEFLGFVTGESKRQVLDEADIFVLVSYQENYGVAVAEAMAAGVPVVITKGVGIWRTVLEYEAGLVVEGVPDAVAGAIVQLLEDREMRLRLGQGGVRLVRERYSPSAIGSEVLSMYKEAAAHRRSW